MSCIGCEFTKYPVCAIQNIISSINFDDIFNNVSHKETPFPICHKNAQSIDGNKIIKKDTCDSCMLCDFVCPFSTKAINTQTEDLALDNLNRLNILLKSSLPGAFVATEVKVKGNSREKRIDLVVKKDTEIFIIKVLSDLNKYNFYTRSYESIANLYSGKYPTYHITKYILINSKKIENALNNEYNCNTLYELIETIQEI